MAIVKVSWSGGKDSSCAVMKRIENGDHVKVVCYVPMFTATIPLITKKHHDFIMRTAELFRSLEAEVYIVTGITYCEQVMRRSTRGKYKGRIFGFPHFVKGLCHFKRDSKVKALQQVDVGQYDFEDIGIAADETNRHGQLSDKLRSILCELGITEADAKQYCIERGIYSPHYDRRKRDGCALCPFANDDERAQWFQDYPEVIPILWELQEFVRRERPDTSPLRGHKWFIDTKPNYIKRTNAT
jgi:hypothetical protein